MDRFPDERFFFNVAFFSSFVKTVATRGIGNHFSFIAVCVCSVVVWLLFVFDAKMNLNLIFMVFLFPFLGISIGLM